jgi:hypothetical protein
MSWRDQHINPASSDRALASGRDVSVPRQQVGDVRGRKRSRSNDRTRNNSGFNRIDYGGGRENHRNRDRGENCIDYGGNRDRYKNDRYGGRSSSGYDRDHRSVSRMNIGANQPDQGAREVSDTVLDISYGPKFIEASQYLSQCFSDTGHIN